MSSATDTPGLQVELFSYYRSSASWRVRIVLAHKQIAHRILPVHLLRGEQREEAYGRIQPLHQVPALRLLQEGEEPLVLTQSVAICEYLEERWPQSPLLPPQAEDRARVRAMVETVNAGIQPLQNLSVRRHLKRALQQDDVIWSRLFVARGLDALQALAAQNQGPFLHGEQPTLADACLVPQLYGARRLEMDLSPYSRLCEAEKACEGLELWGAARPENQPDWEDPQ